MTDPAVAYTPDEDYAAFHRGVEMDVWLKNPNGSYALGLVWPGVTVYPGKLQSGLDLRMLI
jgi:alpha-glucosidase